MTRFWRGGFWRTSVYGVPHWVEGHFVDRDIWDRTGYSHNDGHSFYATRLREARAGRSYSSTYVNPNANCPECGAEVFFFQNEHGSRVFFDELGPPWPKHPCTDNSLGSRAFPMSAAGSTAPPVRSQEEVSLVRQWLRAASLDPEQVFVATYRLSPWVAYELVGRFGGRRKSAIVLRFLSEERPHRIYLRVKGLPDLRIGTLVFYYKGWISFFDQSELRSVELEVERLRGASHFVEELLSKSARRRGAT